MTNVCVRVCVVSKHLAVTAGLLQLNTVDKHIKNYRPSYLVMTGEPRERMHLVRFVHTLRCVCGGGVCVGGWVCVWVQVCV